MKPIKYSIYTLIAVVLATCLSCKKEEPVKIPDKITISSETALTFDDKEGTAEIVFTATNNWSINYVNQKIEWCTFSPASGTEGNCVVTLKVAQNDTYDERNVGLKITCGTSTQQLLITQKQHDAILLTSDKLEVEADGGSYTLDVQSNVDYEVEIDKDCADWVALSGTKGMYQNSVVLGIAKNDNVEARSGKVYLVSGDIKEEVNIYQAGGEPQFILTTKEFNVDGKGGDITVEFSTNSEYSYKISDNSWIKESASPQSMSSYKLYFHIESNSSFTSRKGNIIFTNKLNNENDTVYINQYEEYAIIVDKDSVEIDHNGGPVAIKLSSNIDYTYTIEESCDWIHPAENTEAEDMKDSEIDLTVDENATFEDRTGHITINSGEYSKDVTILQKGMQVLSVSQESFNIDYKAADLIDTVVSFSEYTIEIDQPWVAVAPVLTSESPEKKVLCFHVEESMIKDGREAHILLNTGVAETSKTITVSQSGLGRISLIMEHMETALKSPEWNGDSVFGTVDWGDGTVEEYQSGMSHDFSDNAKKNSEFDMKGTKSFYIPAINSISTITIVHNK